MAFVVGGVDNYHNDPVGDEFRVTIETDDIATAAIQANAVETAKILDANVTIPKLEEQMQRSVDVTITSAEVLALFTTEIEVIATPGVDKAIIFEGAVVFKAAGTAYGSVAAGDDLILSYVDASGVIVAELELTGFADSAAAEMRFLRPHGEIATSNSGIEPVANAALVASILLTNIDTGDSDFILRIYYRVVPTVLT